MTFNITNYEFDLEGNTFEIKLKSGGFVSLDMNFEVLDVNNIGHEHDFTSDDLKDIFFYVDGNPVDGMKIYSGLQLVQWAQSVHDDVLAETEQEARDEEAMARELSCPAATGRI